MTAESCWDLQGLEGSCRHGACPQRVRDLNLLGAQGTPRARPQSSDTGLCDKVADNRASAQPPGLCLFSWGVRASERSAPRKP